MSSVPLLVMYLTRQDELHMHVFFLRVGEAETNNSLLLYFFCVKCGSTYDARFCAVSSFPVFQ